MASWWTLEKTGLASPSIYSCTLTFETIILKKKGHWKRKIPKFEKNFLKCLIGSQNTEQIFLSIIVIIRDSYKDGQNNKNIAGRKEVQMQPTREQNTLCC